MATPAPTTQSAHPLAHLSGTIRAGRRRQDGRRHARRLARASGSTPKNVVVIEPQPSPDIAALAARGVRINPPRDAVGEVAAIVIAVKPQVAPEVAAGARAVGRRQRPWSVSIMAGRTLRFLEAGACRHAALVRAMPNTPAAIGRGITVAVAERARLAARSARSRTRCCRAIGAVEWVDDEALMDAVTAVSGSGPAYVFLLAEALARAGVAAGLPADLADKLARATVAGSGELLHRSPLDAATLRQNVTSPGGTTAAALDVLMATDGLDPLMTKAIAAATRRSRELADSRPPWHALERAALSTYAYVA